MSARANDEMRLFVFGEEVDTNFSSNVSMPSLFLGVKHWLDLVSATNNDGHEYGYSIGINREGSPVESERLEGYPAITDGTGTVVEKAGLMPPIYPFGFRRARQVKKATYIHTHPLPDTDNHPSTGTFSDRDIHYFVGSDYFAMIMLDRGGAHLLAKDERFTRDRAEQLNQKLVETTVYDVREGSKSMRDILKRVAYNLSIYGISYYYTPELLQASITVEFQNLRQARAVLTPST